MFSLSGTLSLYPSLRDSYCPDWNLEDGQISIENLSNGVAIVRRLATSKFDPTAIEVVA